MAFWTLQTATAVPQDDVENNDDGLLQERLALAPASSMWRKRWVQRTGFTASLVAMALLVYQRRSAASPHRQHAVEVTEMLGLASSGSCSAFGVDCRSTQCCQNGGADGYQCYEKSKDWAQCMEGCDPGVHPGETKGHYNASGQFVLDPWSCKKLGPKSKPDPCSAPGEDCRSTKCCSVARGGTGMTCFEKDENYASCKETCDDDDWTCKALGERTPFPADCTWAGGSCADTHLCCNRGFECVKRDDQWTTCFQTVKKETWVTKRFPIPASWDGTVMGGGRNEYEVAAAKEGEKKAGTSLYCFIAYLPDSYEVDLIKEAKHSKASIFQCDDHDLFHSWQSAKAGWDTGEKTLSNTEVFIDVWKHVIESGKFLAQDWTVKVDADAVLIPFRLKAHITALNPPAYRPLYLKNNDMDPGMGNSGFLGAVEVFSKQAVQIYGDNYEGCRKTLGVDAGEDGFMKGCMDALGVGYMTDAHLFFPDKSAGVCNMGVRAAFHPLKTAKDWRCCLDITNGINHLVEYGNCHMEYPPKGEKYEE